jgi:hypothetical protein
MRGWKDTKKRSACQCHLPSHSKPYIVLTYLLEQEHASPAASEVRPRSLVGSRSC